MTATIQISGLDKLKKELDPKAFERTLRVGMAGAVDIVRAQAKEYPPSPSASDKKRAWSGMSQKQRRWFFANLRRGTIQVPYVRGSSPGSEKLGASWFRRVQTRFGELVGTVGSNVSYGPYVMDEDQQATIHRGRWQTIQDVVEKTADDVIKLFDQVIERWAK